MDPCPTQCKNANDCRWNNTRNDNMLSVFVNFLIVSMSQWGAAKKKKLKKKAGFSRLVSGHVVESFLEERQWETLITSVTHIYHVSLSIEAVTS